MKAPSLLLTLRIPLLIALLVAAGQPKAELFRAFTRLEMEAALTPWALLVASGLLFVALALITRGRRHPPAVLAVEALAAAVIGLVPPTAWVQWFGLGGLGTALWTTGNMFVQALAIAWLGIVLATAVRQVRSGRSRVSGETSERCHAGSGGRR